MNQGMRYTCTACGKPSILTTCGACGAPATESGEPDPARPAAAVAPAAGSSGRQGVVDLESFRIGQVVSRSLGIWLRNLLPFAGISLLIHAPLVYFNILATRQPLEYVGAWPQYTHSIVGMLVGQLLAAILIDAVFQILRGRAPGVGRSIQNGVAALPRVLGVSLVAFLLAVAVIAVFVIPFALTAELGSRALTFLFAGLGALALLWLMVRLWAAVAVAVVEAPGPVAAVRRAWSLSEGLRMRIFLLILVTGFLSFLFQAPFLYLSTLLSPRGLLSLAERNADLATSAVIASFGAAVQAVGYHDLRRAKEGVETEELAAIFD